MDINKIIKFADIFYSLASETEPLPPNSKDLKTILKNIENLETYNARKKYAEKNLKHLSSGSSRIAYLTLKKTVIKLAKNDKGIAQNKAEAANIKVKSKYLNKVLKYSKKYSWIEMPFLKKLTEKKFKKMTGLNFDDFGDSIRYGLRDISSSKTKKPDNFEEVEKSEIFKEFLRIGKEAKLMGGDLARISNIGEIGDHPIIIDSGLTKKVFEEFYET